MKREATGQKKIFDLKIAEKRLVSKIYKELLNLNNKKTSSPVIKGGKRSK